MAQNTAHVTQTLQATPSIFELVAADSFQSTFYPALKRIAQVNIELLELIFNYNLNCCLINTFILVSGQFKSSQIWVAGTIL